MEREDLFFFPARQKRITWNHGAFFHVNPERQQQLTLDENMLLATYL
jgi:hypothetical protein